MAPHSTARLALNPTPPSYPRRSATVLDGPAYTGGLREAYRAVLADFDARTAQFIPHQKITNTGVALLLQRSIEDADTAIRARKHDEELAAAAAAELRRQQMAHPLYRTHHQRDLLRYWQTHGQPPRIPDRALDAFTPYIQRKAAADDTEIQEMAEQLEKVPTITLRERLGPYADRFLDPLKPTDRTAKNLRRVLRAAIRQYNEQAAHVLQLVAKNGQRYVSDHTRHARKHQLDAQRTWINNTVIIDKTKENPTEKDRIPLAMCIRTPEHRFSELYTLVRGQEKYFTALDYIPLFITLTTPAEYHPHPAVGNDTWDGSSVADSHQWFTENWKNTRALLEKHGIRLDGFRVTEPHRDGAEHWHLLCYVKKDQLTTVRDTITTYFGHSDHSVQFKADFTGPVRPGKATAAGYMMKYLIKTISAGASAGTSAANDQEFAAEADAADAWRSTWNIRAFQFYGTIFGHQTHWREWRRQETQPTPEIDKQLWRAARGGRADRFIAILINDDPELKTLREMRTEWTTPDDTTGEIEQHTKKGRVIGISSNGRQYITHTTAYRLETDHPDLKEDSSRLQLYISTQVDTAADPAEGTDPPPKPPDHHPWTWAHFTKVADQQQAERDAQRAAGLA